MTSFLYGRLTGNGAVKTASASRNGAIRTRAETRHAGIEVTLLADGSVAVAIGRKQHDKAAHLSDVRPVWEGNIDTLTRTEAVVHA